MKRFTIFIFILICFSGFSQELSFSEALATMQSKNQKLKGVEKQSQATEYATQAMKGHYFPTLSVNGSYVHLKDNLYLNFNGERDQLAGLASQYAPLLGQFPTLASAIMPYFQQDWKYKFQNQNIGRLSVDLNWPIYTGGKIRAGVKAEKTKAEITKIEAEKTNALLISELAERYFQVQLANEAVKVRQQSLQTAQKHLYNAQKLEANGMLAPVETMQAKSTVADAERELKGAEKDVQLALTALHGVMGTDEGFLGLQTPLFEIPPLENLEVYQNLAKANYPEIRQAKLKKTLAEQHIKAQQSEFIPNVALVGKKYVWKENLPITEPNDWYVGVGFQWDIFKGLQNKRRYQQAKAISESVDLLTAQAERDIQILVKKHYTEIEKQREQITSLKESIRFADELVRVREKAFAEGLGSSTDVADANLYLASLKIKHLQALFAMDKTLAEMLEICGQSQSFVNYTL